MTLTRGDSSITHYLSKLKVLWEEINEHGPKVTCSRDSLRPFLDHLHWEHVLQFFMGMNDEFSQVRGQILMIEPLPPINKAYSLVVQEE